MHGRANLFDGSGTFGVMTTYDNLARVEPEPTPEKLETRARFDDTYRTNRDFILSVVRRMGLPAGDD